VRVHATPEQPPIAGASSLLVMVLVATFFVTWRRCSYRWGIGTLSQRRKLSPRRPVVASWGVVTGGVAVLMPWAGGTDALDGLQTMTIISRTIVVVMICNVCPSTSISPALPWPTDTVLPVTAIVAAGSQVTAGQPVTAVGADAFRC
jgi:choline-glycine betaine transporter